MDDKEKSLKMASVLIAHAEAGDVEQVRGLVKLGYPVDMRNRDGETALMWACAYGNLDVVDFLIESGCNVDAQSQTGFRAVMDASLCAEGV